jgi:hypothetical protein
MQRTTAEFVAFPGVINETMFSKREGSCLCLISKVKAAAKGSLFPIILDDLVPSTISLL